MWRRWIIRSVLLSLLLMCMGAWGWSGTRGYRVSYCRGSFYGACGMGWGVMYVDWLRNGSQPPGWGGDVNRLGPFHWWPVALPHSYWGFFLERGHVEDVSYASAHIPFWFLTLVLALVALLVWRKTRPHLRPETAFPIELAAKKERP